MSKFHLLSWLVTINCVVLITQAGSGKCWTANKWNYVIAENHNRSFVQRKAMPWIQLLMLNQEDTPPIHRGWVGPLGGTVTDPNGASILVPPGALSNKTLISVQTHTNTSFLPSPAQFVGGAKFGPAGLAFQLPATITFPLTNKLPTGSGLPLFMYDDQRDGWLLTEFSALVNKDEMSASAEITHFSDLIAFGPPHDDLNIRRLQERFKNICSPTPTSDLFDEFVDWVSNTFIIGQKKLWDFSGYDLRRCYACYEIVGLSFFWEVSRSVPSTEGKWINIEDSSYERNLNEGEWYDPSLKQPKEGVFPMIFRDFFDVQVSDINCGGDYQLVYELNMVVWLRCTNPSLELEAATAELETGEHTTVSASLMCGTEGMEEQQIDLTLIGDVETNPTQIITDSNGAGEVDLYAINPNCSDGDVSNAIVRAEYEACRDQGIPGEIFSVAETTIGVSEVSLSGEWNGTEIADERDCGEGINTYTGTGTLTHTGSSIVFNWPTGYFLGTKNGCTINVWGGEREDGGVSYGEGSLTISQDGRTISGSGDWTWTGEDSSCSGTSDLTLTR